MMLRSDRVIILLNGLYICSPWLVVKQLHRSLSRTWDASRIRKPLEIPAQAQAYLFQASQGLPLTQGTLCSTSSNSGTLQALDLIFARTRTHEIPINLPISPGPIPSTLPPLPISVCSAFLTISRVLWKVLELTLHCSVAVCSTTLMCHHSVLESSRAHIRKVKKTTLFTTYFVF